MSADASAPPPVSLAVPLLTAAIAVAIFVIDTLTPLDIAIAVLYVGVVLLALDFTDYAGILAVAAGCAVLTFASFLISHGGSPSAGPMLRCLVSLCAISITALLAARNQKAVAADREKASLLDLTHDTVFVRDRNDVIVYWNRAAEELYGWTSREAIGQRAADLLKTVFPGPLSSIMAELERDARWAGELMHVCKGGDTITVSSRWALQRDGRAQRTFILETNNDITLRRAVEDTLEQARMELAHVARVATLGELTASIAHEVNQPLAAVVANGEAGLRWIARPVPELSQTRTSIEAMIRNAQRASDVIRRLRAMSRKAEPIYAPIALAALAEESIQLVERELNGHGVQLSVRLPSDLPQILGDRIQLQQVVINLLMNGAQAMAGMPAERRLLSVVAESALRDEGNVVLLRIDDSGQGIPEASMPRLFDAFFTTKDGGMGMGLSISRSIVEAHRGQIWAENRRGGGASFFLALPFATDKDDA